MSCAHCGKGPIRAVVEHAHGEARSYCGEVCARSDCPATAEPFKVNLYKAALDNEDYARTIYSGALEIKLIALKIGDDIPREAHEGADQLLRVEEGRVKIVIGCGKETILLEEGEVCVVPKGTYHRVINSDAGAPSKLSSVYSPAQHPKGRLYKTRADAL